MKLPVTVLMQPSLCLIWIDQPNLTPPTQPNHLIQQQLNLVPGQINDRLLTQVKPVLLNFRLRPQVKPALLLVVLNSRRLTQVNNLHLVVNSQPNYRTRLILVISLPIQPVSYLPSQFLNCVLRGATSCGSCGNFTSARRRSRKRRLSRRWHSRLSRGP
uniref:Uncharacterized protein n=1 Tax=Cacopsylla melanoneura TaxID=428564 RepID=A0A8D8Q4K1_9HEMI